LSVRCAKQSKVKLSKVNLSVTSNSNTHDTNTSHRSIRIDCIWKKILANKATRDIFLEYLI